MEEHHEKYGIRLNRASLIEYKKFWSGYRLIVTLSGVSAPALLQIQHGVHSMLSFAEAIESGAIGLLLSLSGTYLYSRRKGAEALDVESVTALDKARSQVNNQEAQIVSLQELIRRKHPHDEKKESDIRKAWNVLTETQQDVFTWLLDAGEASRGVLQLRGLDADLFYQNKDFPRLLAFRSFRPGNGIAEIDRFYYINPDMKEALRNVLYPPEQPVP